MKQETKNPSVSGALNRIRHLYETRRVGLGGLNSRNRLTMVYSMLMIAVLTSAFANRSRSIDNWRDFLDGRTDMKLLDESTFTFRVATPVLSVCDDRCQLLGAPLNQPFTLEPATNLARWNTQGRLKPSPDKKIREGIWASAEITIPASEMRKSNIEAVRLAVTLPAVKFRQALVAVNGIPWGRYLDNQRIVIRMPKESLLSADLTVAITAQLPDDGIAFEELSPHIPAFIGSHAASRELEKYLILDRDTRGNVMGTMSRILIAFFALFIFVVIDSTPESFGLAMFLGSEAVALVLSDHWINVPYAKLYVHMFSQMGDIFRLYFFIQLSRLFKPNTAYWLICSTLLSIPYGYARYMEVEWGIQGLDIIPRYRDFTAGTLGTIFCLAALLSIRTAKLPWRKAALMLGALCSIQQILGPLLHYFPEWNNSQNFRQFFNTYETLYTYLGVLSALTNLSTLENRVSRLSQAKAHGDMIEQELALGQTVQRSFLNTPHLPSSFEVAQANEAAVYVSGDIFFIHWDESQDRLILLMCDVTGHGVQAALKATACYMLARNIWSGSNEIFQHYSSEQRFNQFRQQQDDLMRLFSDTPDIPTFSAVEICPKQNIFYSYRTNFNTPLIVEPAPFGSWTVRSEALPDATTRACTLVPGCLIVLFSDGYVNSSRHLSRLMKYLGQKLSGFDGSPESLKNIIIAFDRQNPDRPDDDRTMLVLAWQRRHARFRPETKAATETEFPSLPLSA